MVVSICLQDISCGKIADCFCKSVVNIVFGRTDTNILTLLNIFVILSWIM